MQNPVNRLSATFFLLVGDIYINVCITHSNKLRFTDVEKNNDPNSHKFHSS